MKLQLALDRLSIDEAINIAKPIEPYFDWLEVGTSLIKEYGMESIKKIREQFPNKFIVADIKTVDSAEYEFEMCFKHGADAATVMGSSPVKTIEICKKVASKNNKLVIIDLLNAPKEQLPYIFQCMDAMLCMHIGIDQQDSFNTGDNYKFDIYKPFLTNIKPKISIAGGISRQSLPINSEFRPEVLIVGKGITQSENRLIEAKELYNKIKFL